MAKKNNIFARLSPWGKADRQRDNSDNSESGSLAQEEAQLDPDGYDPGVVPGENTPDSDKKWLRFILRQFEACAQNRLPMELDWALALAYEEGRQWLAKSLKGDEIASLINEDERTRYVTANLIRPLLMKVTAIATQSSPDVQFVPVTNNPNDAKAAKVAEAIHTHYSSVYDRVTQTTERVSWALKSTTSFLKIYQDDTMEQRVPILSTDLPNLMGGVTGQGAVSAQSPSNMAQSLPPAPDPSQSIQQVDPSQAMGQGMPSQMPAQASQMPADAQMGQSLPNTQGVGGMGQLPAGQQPPEPTNPLADMVETTEVVVIGGVREEVVPGFEVYLDPLAKRWEQVRYLFHVQVKPIGWFATKFGEKGKEVRPDMGLSTGTTSGFVDSYLRGGTRPGVGVSPTAMYDPRLRKHSAVYYEYWELPSDKRPKGLYICASRDVILHIGDWPYDKVDDFPFVPLSYQSQAGTPYGRSLSAELMSLQLVYNRTYSRILEQMEGEVDYLMAPNGSGIGPDGFERIKGTRTRVPVAYDPQAGSPPVVSRAPGISPAQFQFLDRTQNTMRDIAGVHDVSEGVAPAGTPAEGVNLLQKADQTQHAGIRNGIECSAKMIAEWEVALTKQFWPEEILFLAFSGGTDTDNSEGGIAGLHDIKSIIDGVFHIRVIPGSAFQTTPEEKDQQLLQFAQMGLLTPENPAASIFWEACSRPDKDKIAGLIQQAQQAQQQQMQAQQQAQLAAQQGQQTPQIDPQTQVQIDAQKKKNDVTLEMQRNQHQAGLDMQKAAIQKKMDIESQQAMAQFNAQLNPQNALGGMHDESQNFTSMAR